MKKAVKGIAIGTAAVCLLAGVAGSPEKAESLELSIPFSRDEYDINTDIPVEISVSPDGASIDDLEYFADSDTVSFADSVINTGQTEGDYSFYVRSGDVGSNVLSIHVVDITARNEAAQKAEEERLAKEAEEKRAAEEAEEQNAATEQAVQEAEEQNATEEQVANEVEEEAAAEHTASDIAADAPEADPAPAPQPAEEPVQIVEEQAQVVTDNTTAYLSATGSKYHSIDHCGKMNPDNAIKTTVSEAEASNHERCSKCW